MSAPRFERTAWNWFTRTHSVGLLRGVVVYARHKMSLARSRSMTKTADLQRLEVHAEAIADGFGALHWFARQLVRYLPSPLPQGEVLQRAIVTAAVAWLFLFVAPIYAGLIWVLQTPPSWYYLLAVETAVGTSSGLWLLSRGKYRTATWLVLTTGSIAVALPFLREGLSTPAASNFIIVIVMAALMTGWRGLIGLAIPFAALVVGVSWAEGRGLFHGNPESSSGVVFVLMQLLSITVMLVIFDRTRDALHRTRDQLEEQLASAKRFEAIGKLAGGIAHDFNNQLTVVLANTSMLLDADLPAEFREDVEGIRTAAERSAEMTRQLLALSRKQRLNPTTFDLNSMLSDLQALLCHALPKQVSVECRLSNDPAWVRADINQMTQLVLSLASHAGEQMPTGGTLTITTEFLRHARRPLQAGVEHAEVRLRLEDSSRGLDRVEQEQLFEPFFGQHRGARGLALASVKATVTQSGGTISVQSQPGQGTQFDMHFPLAEAPSGRLSSAPAPSQVRPVSGETIFVIEDDREILASASRILRAEGYRLLEACGAKEAERIYQDERCVFDLVLSDVILQDGVGPLLVDRWLKSRPFRVVFMSGYLDQFQHDPLVSRAPFLAKPFTAEELCRRVRQALDKAPMRPVSERARVQ